jgi:hypothetical protein
MHISFRASSGLAALALVATSAGLAGAPAKAKAAAGGFELTVDSIMRGPKLVGYPPTGLRCRAIPLGSTSVARPTTTGVDLGGFREPAERLASW